MLVMIIFASCSEQQAPEKEPAGEAQETNAPTIKGAWEMTNYEYKDADTTETWKPYKSLYLYTDKHYSVEIATEERPSWAELAEGEERSSEDIRNAYQGLISNSGTYEIQGDSLITYAVIAKSPNYMNDNPRRARHITIKENEIVFSGVEDDASWKVTLKRIE